MTLQRRTPLRALERYRVEDCGYVTPCWITTYAPQPRTGYATTHVNGVSVSLHRLAYEHAKGAIPPEKQIDHLCRVRLCVNPDHLEAVTSAENNRRRPWCKLTPETADEIRRRCDSALRAAGPTKRTGQPRRKLPRSVVEQIADEFGVSIWTVMDVRRRTWR
jgi:HNH endonuclease